MQELSRFHPINDCVIFVNHKACSLADYILARERSIFEKFGIEVNLTRPVSNGYETLGCLLPLTSHQIRRTLVVPTSGRWTAVFNNSINGTDPSAAPALSLNLKTQCLVVARVPEVISSIDSSVKHPHGGTCHFEIYDYNSKNFNNCARYIHATNEDGRWTFEQGGISFSFEKIEKYQSKKVRDRLNSEIVVDYLERFQIDVDNECFYDWKNSILIEKHGPSPVGMKEDWEVPRKKYLID